MGYTHFSQLKITGERELIQKLREEKLTPTLEDLDALKVEWEVVSSRGISVDSTYLEELIFELSEAGTLLTVAYESRNTVAPEWVMQLASQYPALTFELFSVLDEDDAPVGTWVLQPAGEPYLEEWPIARRKNLLIQLESMLMEVFKPEDEDHEVSLESVMDCYSSLAEKERIYLSRVLAEVSDPEEDILDLDDAFELIYSLRDSFPDEE